jgi:hypothetical protein
LDRDLPISFGKSLTGMPVEGAENQQTNQRPNEVGFVHSGRIKW